MRYRSTNTSPGAKLPTSVKLLAVVRVPLDGVLLGRFAGGGSGFTRSAGMTPAVAVGMSEIELLGSPQLGQNRAVATISSRQ